MILLPTRLDPEPGESLNSFVARLAQRNRVPISTITGAGQFVMRPNLATVNNISTASGLPATIVRSMAVDAIPGFSVCEPMELNTSRRQFCRQCSDVPELKEWYLPVTFACRRCRVLLTDGTSEQRELNANTMAIQYEIFDCAARAQSGDKFYRTIFRWFGRLYRDARGLAEPQWPQLSSDTTTLLPELSVSTAPTQLARCQQIPIHPPTFALAAVTLWRRATMEIIGRNSNGPIVNILDTPTARAQIAASHITRQVLGTTFQATGHTVADLALLNYLYAYSLPGDSLVPLPFPSRLPRSPIPLDDREIAVLARHCASTQPGNTP